MPGAGSWRSTTSGSVRVQPARWRHRTNDMSSPSAEAAHPLLGGSRTTGRAPAHPLSSSSHRGRGVDARALDGARGRRLCPFSPCHQGLRRSPVTRHNDFRDAACMRCVALDLVTSPARWRRHGLEWSSAEPSERVASGPASSVVPGGVAGVWNLRSLLASDRLAHDRQAGPEGVARLCGRDSEGRGSGPLSAVRRSVPVIALVTTSGENPRCKTCVPLAPGFSGAIDGFAGRGVADRLLLGSAKRVGRLVLRPPKVGSVRRDRPQHVPLDWDFGPRPWARAAPSVGDAPDPSLR